ncbi:MAG TPA: hypothetical protein VHP32_06610 [Ignavibacteria bacterium]|nr:hypothetical protein [Ignavibacteria bacterium]
MEPITFKHIEGLNPFQFVSLLKLLLKLEAIKSEIPLSAVTVPLNLTVADGGEDARIEWEETDKNEWYKNSNYINSPLTIFQSKASPMSPEQCKLEVSDKISKINVNGKVYNLTTTIKKRIKDVIDKDGSYILFINKNYTKNAIQKRIEKVKEAFKDVDFKNYNDIKVDVYDANKIADWANQYFQAVNYLYDCRVGIRIPDGIKSMNILGMRADFQNIFRSNSFLQKKVTELQNSVAKTRQTIRINGLSGLGKTRLIYESFKNNSNDNLQTQLLKSSIIYFDALIPGTDIHGFVTKLIDNGLKGILIVDNCELTLHQKLQGEIKRIDSKLNLISIDYETAERYDSIDEINSILIKPENLDNIITEIIKDLFPDLNNQDVDKIKEFVKGFPLLAVLLSDQYLKEDSNIGRINNDSLLRKLIFGRSDINNDEFEVLKTLAIFDKLGFSEDRQVEMNFVACNKRLCGLNFDDETCKKKFYETCVKYKEKGLIEQGGRYIFLKPKPLAITLAAKWWETVQPDILEDILLDITSNNLGSALCDQLRYLDFLEQTKEFVEKLCGEQAPFGKAEVLNTELGSRLFRSLVEVNPSACTNALVRIFGNMSKENLFKIDKGRRNLIWALEKIVWRKETFSDGMKVLLNFAVAENESWANNATGEFLKRFHVILPATEATLEERFNIIKYSYSRDIDYKKIAVDALKSALHTHYFTRDVGAENQGSSKSLIDFKPTFKERDDYWIKCLNLLYLIYQEKNEFSNEAENILSNSIRGLISHGLFDLIIPIIKTIATEKNFLWNEARNDLQLSLKYEKDILTPEQKTTLSDFILKLTPQDILEKYKLFIKSSAIEDEIGENDSYTEKLKQTSEKIAIEFGNNFNKLIYSFDIIYNDYQHNGYYFGEKLGTLLNSENRNVFIEKSINYFKNSNENLNIIVFIGFLIGIENKEIVKDIILKFINDDKIAKYSFDISSSTYVDEEIFDNLINLANKLNNLKLLLSFRYSRSIEKLKFETNYKLLKKISEFNLLGALIALSIYSNLAFRNKQNWAQYKTGIKEILSKKGLIGSHNLNMIEHYWEQYTVKILEEDNDTLFAIHIMNEIIDMCSQEDYKYNFELYIQNILTHLLPKYFTEIWPVLSQALLSDFMTYYHLMHLIGSRIEFNDNFSEDLQKNFDNKNGLLFKSNNELVLDWCKKNIPLAPQRIARYLPIFSNKKRNEWHSFTLQFINEFGSDRKVLNEISANMGSYSWTGSLVPLLRSELILYENLSNHKNDIIRTWANENINYLNKYIKAEKIDDEERYL